MNELFVVNYPPYGTERSFSAVLFVQAKVTAWQEVPVACVMTQAQFEAFVVASVKNAGLDSVKAFALAVRGKQMNVV